MTDEDKTRSLHAAKIVIFHDISKFFWKKSKLSSKNYSYLCSKKIECFMLVKTFCAAVNGLEVTTVTVEVSMSRGVQFHLTGLADTAVKESYDRIKAALINNGFKMPTMEITANLSPADIKKEGSGYDLPLAVGILAANGKVENERLDKYMLVDIT